MSGVKKSSKLDLLVRVRYSNPLPAPPCPPKLLEIPTNPKRYARPELLTSIARQTPLPMIVDADCGMPLDLSQYECLWDESLDDSVLNPSADILPKLDPRDELLAFEVPTASTSNGGTNNPGTQTLTANVSWLRKTEYTSKSESRSNVTESTRDVDLAPVDVSPEAQIHAIEDTFKNAHDNFDISTLRHPTKPHLHAEESFELLPDADVWANQYMLFRFAERPGGRPVEEEDPRLEVGIFRPVTINDESIIAYYLNEDDEGAAEYKAARESVVPYDIPITQGTIPFRFVRDYSTTTATEGEAQTEFLLVIDEGPSAEEDVFGDEEDDQYATKSRPKGAYYKDISRKVALKRQRNTANLDYAEKVDRVNLDFTKLTEKEEDTRDAYRAQVREANWIQTEEEHETQDVEMAP
ncbi:RNA polymerase II-associated protein [Cylindrobasidium torrendii FP15055 ss-10]|uniref:RNA polymerase II-associated protein n=1 Tax=Cylindrobasidium torrendii FP15055 ss-10 TaxID=1314674 RepID=A0A0D7BFA3_9AGAR|nr:RNA polymerase II-associated protein [Cylindrobasidium torrendii FP15055 ss-10]